MGISRLLNNQRHRGIALQALFVLSVLTLALAAFFIGKSNLQQQGLSFSFDFLKQATGWDMGFSLLDSELSDTYHRYLWLGILNTLFLGTVSLLGATLIGSLVALARISNNKLLNLLGTTYVELFRNIPLILQALFWYAVFTHLPNAKQALSFFDLAFLSGRGLYLPALNIEGKGIALAALIIVVGFVLARLFMRSRLMYSSAYSKRKRVSRLLVLMACIVALIVLFQFRIPNTELITYPQLKGLNFKGGIRITPEFSAAFTAISLYGASFLSEIFRAGLMTTRKGLLEAGSALGLSQNQVLTRIHFPMALRAVLPTLTNQYVWLLKATTIGIAVGFSDFFMVVATSINQNGQSLALIVILLGGFLMINITLSSALNLLNKSIKLRGTQLR
jgi:His/Glu/Gln/Arg/opine family amino acid ABC transporter permease subunit